MPHFHQVGARTRSPRARPFKVRFWQTRKIHFLHLTIERVTIRNPLERAMSAFNFRHEAQHNAIGVFRYLGVGLAHSSGDGI